MLIAPEFAAEEEPAARRARFWARLGQEQIAACLLSELGFEPGLLYLHLLAQPVGEGEAETLAYADVEQLAQALRSDETSAFLGARIEEVWQQTSRLQQVLRAVPYGFVAQIATEAGGLVNLRCEKQENQNHLPPPQLERV